MANRSIRKCWVPVAVASATAALVGAPAVAAGPVAATAGTSAAAALIVGGTTFPTLEQSFMEALWPTWNNSLGLANLAAPRLINVAYPAELAPFTDGDPLGLSVAAGMNNLLNLLTATYSEGEHLLVWGISQGALVLNAAQRVLALDPAAAPPAAALTFIRVADPAAAVTGMLNFLPNFILSDLLRLDDSVRTATAYSQYDTIVVNNEYDAFADFPDRFNLLAVANAIVGLWYRHGQTGTVDLTTVPAQNISTTTNALGATITTYLVPSPFLPLTQLLRDAGMSTAVADKLDSAWRPIIEAGYTRNDVPVVPADTARTPTAVDAAPVPVAEQLSETAEPNGATAEPATIVEPASATAQPAPVAAVAQTSTTESVPTVRTRRAARPPVSSTAPAEPSGRPEIDRDRASSQRRGR